MRIIPWMTVLLWMNLGADSWTDSSPETSRLSLIPPHSIFIQGEEVTLKCSVPDTHQLQIFFFRCKNESGSSILEKAHQRNTWNISTAHLNETRKLICSCWSKSHIGTGTKWSYSPQSHSREFLVVEILPPPLLQLDPLSQRVKEGDPLVFLCLTEGSLTEKKFHFYKDGVEITSIKEGLLEPSSEPTNPLQRASLRIPHASFNHSGEFACSYEEKRSNRWVTSPLSQGTNVTVERVGTQDSDPIWRYSRITISLIILLVPFAFYCWKKKRTSPPKEQSQLAEKKEEGGDLGMMEPPAARAATPSPVKDSEAAYSNIPDFFPPSPPGPARKNLLTQEKTGKTLYCNLNVSQLKKKEQNHP